jgi:hypothetical protein
MQTQPETGTLGKCEGTGKAHLRAKSELAIVVQAKRVNVIAFRMLGSPQHKCCVSATRKVLGCLPDARVPEHNRMGNQLHLLGAPRWQAGADAPQSTLLTCAPGQ